MNREYGESSGEEASEASRAGERVAGAFHRGGEGVTVAAERALLGRSWGTHLDVEAGVPIRPLPGSTFEDAERRRQRGAEAVEERMRQMGLIKDKATRAGAKAPAPDAPPVPSSAGGQQSLPPTPPPPAPTAPSPTPPLAESEGRRIAGAAEAGEREEAP